MEQNYVEFYSPGSFISESTQKEIDSWDVDKAVEMVKDIKDRYGAVPYGFKFIKRGRTDQELDSKILARSGMYYLGGTIYTLAEIEAKNDSNDEILISNMKCNRYEKIIVNNNSWEFTGIFSEGDQIVAF